MYMHTEGPLDPARIQSRAVLSVLLHVLHLLLILSLAFCSLSRMCGRLCVCDLVAHGVEQKAAASGQCEMPLHEVAPVGACDIAAHGSEQKLKLEGIVEGPADVIARI